MSVRDNPNSFNRTKSPKLSFEVLDFSFVAQARNKQSFEGIATNLGIIGGFILLNTFGEKLLLLLFFLKLDPVLSL